jgi:hypothetical protein
MKPVKLAGIFALLLALCVPAFARPSSTAGPLRWIHNKHPEKSNPHYKDAHKRVNSHRRARNRKRS